MVVSNLKLRSKPITISLKEKTNGLKFKSWNFGTYEIPSDFPKLILSKSRKIKLHKKDFELEENKLLDNNELGINDSIDYEYEWS